MLNAVPDDEAADESEIRAAYDKITEENKPSFEQVMDSLMPQVSRRQIGDGTYYIRRKTWLSSAEVARRLDVSMRTVQSWGQKGVMGARYVGDRLRFAAKEVEEWVRGNKGGSRVTNVDTPNVLSGTCHTGETQTHKSAGPVLGVRSAPVADARHLVQIDVDFLVCHL